VERARVSIGPQRSKGGMRLYPGLAWGTPPLEGLVFPPGDPALFRVLKARPTWTLATFDPDRDIPPMEDEIGGLLDTWNTDLTPFRAAGGKLILHHGWSDPLLSPYNTIDYYEDVRAKMGDTSDFARLFMTPGMAHCAGGAGPWKFDALAAMVDWVEHGRAPERIVAGHPASFAPNAPIERTRPLCTYPKVARYKGTGSTDDAANFACADPG
jgi:feruloyl esterase